MSQTNSRTVRMVPQGLAAVILVFVICLCVISQMLGAPVTLLGVLISDAPVESLSEDFSIPPIPPKPGTPSYSNSYTEVHSPVHLPIFSTAVFHPPLG